MDRNRPARGGDKGPEETLDPLRRSVRKVQAHSLVQVFHRPASHNAVIAQDDNWSENGQQAQPLPSRPGGQFFHRSERALAAAAADNGFCKENGKHQHETGDHVQDDKGSTTVLTHHVREAPDVPQAHSRSGHGHDHRKAAAEMFALTHIKLETNRTATPTGAT